MVAARRAPHHEVVFRVLDAAQLAPEVVRLWVDAPRVATHWLPGQFVIVRSHDDAERIPLTIADGDADEGWISLIIQNVGAATARLTALRAGDALHDVAGPLGRPTDIEHFTGTVVVIGGGVGTAIAYPSAAALAAAGNRVVAIVGGRSAPYVILEDELRAVCDEVIVVTDDGTHGRRGVVTDALADVIAIDGGVSRVVAIGPIPMMRAVAELTKPRGIDTVVSLNPIMVDGTGMCGGCRVLVGGETKFACVDGPEFDGHLVDFEVLAQRNRAYHAFEAAERAGACGES